MPAHKKRHADEDRVSSHRVQEKDFAQARQDKTRRDDRTASSACVCVCVKGDTYRTAAANGANDATFAALGLWFTLSASELHSARNQGADE